MVTALHEPAVSFASLLAYDDLDDDNILIITVNRPDDLVNDNILILTVNRHE